MTRRQFPDVGTDAERGCFPYNFLRCRCSALHSCNGPALHEPAIRLCSTYLSFQSWWSSVSPATLMFSLSVSSRILSAQTGVRSFVKLESSAKIHSSWAYSYHLGSLATGSDWSPSTSDRPFSKVKPSQSTYGTILWHLFDSAVMTLYCIGGIWHVRSFKGRLPIGSTSWYQSLHLRSTASTRKL